MGKQPFILIGKESRKDSKGSNVGESLSLVIDSGATFHCAPSSKYLRDLKPINPPATIETLDGKTDVRFQGDLRCHYKGQRLIFKNVAL